MKQTDFVFYNGAWIRKNRLKESCQINEDYAMDIMKDGGLYLRNIYNFDKMSSSSFWYVIKDTFGGIEEMPTKTRNDLGFVFERSENMKQCVVLPLHE